MALPYVGGLIDKPSGRFVVKGIVLELLQKLGVAKDGAKHIDDLSQELITNYWNVVPVKETKDAAKKVLVEAHKEVRLPNFNGPGLIFAFAKEDG